MKRSTHAYCPRCRANLSEYGVKACEECGLVFGSLQVTGSPESRHGLVKVQGASKMRRVRSV